MVARCSDTTIGCASSGSSGGTTDVAIAIGSRSSTQPDRAALAASASAAANLALNANDFFMAASSDMRFARFPSVRDEADGARVGRSVRVRGDAGVDFVDPAQQPSLRVGGVVPIGVRADVFLRIDGMDDVWRHHDHQFGLLALVVVRAEE